MSLNRCEHTLYDYVKGHRDEGQYLQEKVHKFVAASPDLPAAVSRIDLELWRYYQERAAVVPAFAAAMGAGGLGRTSMKNLAELLVRLWIDPKPRKSPVEGPHRASSS
jgi:hypothetical protein